MAKRSWRDEVEEVSAWLQSVLVVALAWDGVGVAELTVKMYWLNQARQAVSCEDGH